MGIDPDGGDGPHGPWGRRAMGVQVEGLSWERRPREGERAYAAFLAYRDLGPGRTHEATRIRLAKRPAYLVPIQRWAAPHPPAKGPALPGPPQPGAPPPRVALAGGRLGRPPPRRARRGRPPGSR